MKYLSTLILILPIYRYMSFNKTVTIQLSSGMTKLLKI